MPKLPKGGWLHHCEDCDAITSRIATCKYRRKIRTLSICIGCRHVFLQWMVKEFTSVHIESENVGELVLKIIK
jgi:hypothetical protein